MPKAWTHIHGFQHVSGVPNCSCNDPGNYLRLEESIEDPLHFRYTCWCGSTIEGRYDDAEERSKIHAKLNQKE